VELLITITGLHGVGKTLIGKKLCEYFNLGYSSAGIIFRNIAKEFNMSCAEFNEYALTHPEIDKKIDGITLELAKKGNIIIEGILSSWITRELNPFRILLTAPLEVRIQRIAKRDNITFDEAMEITTAREKAERTRFKRLYDIDILEKNIYDISINTYSFDIDSMIKILTTAINEHKNKKE